MYLVFFLVGEAVEDGADLLGIGCPEAGVACVFVEVTKLVGVVFNVISEDAVSTTLRG